MASANEFAFQNDIIKQRIRNGWLLGKPENYNRELVLWCEDLLGFVLISSAVTDKIDIKNWVAPKPSNNKNKEIAVWAV